MLDHSSLHEGIVLTLFHTKYKVYGANMTFHVPQNCFIALCLNVHLASLHSTALDDSSTQKSQIPEHLERNVHPDENGYEPITPSPTTPTSSPEDYIDISQASTILEHDVDLTTDVMEDFIQEKNERTKRKNKERKRRHTQ